MEAYYKERCKKLEETIQELAKALWGDQIHLAKKVSDLLSEETPQAPETKPAERNTNQSILNKL